MKRREKAIPPQGNARIPEALQRLVRLYEATGKQGEAASWLKPLPDFSGFLFRNHRAKTGPGLILVRPPRSDSKEKTPESSVVVPADCLGEVAPTVRFGTCVTLLTLDPVRPRGGRLSPLFHPASGGSHVDAFLDR